MSDHIHDHAPESHNYPSGCKNIEELCQSEVLLLVCQRSMNPKTVSCLRTKRATKNAKASMAATTNSKMAMIISNSFSLLVSELDFSPYIYSRSWIAD
jgi:hypothetical protein